MAADIFVSFGADTGGLEAGIALAKASVTAMTRELTSLAREMTKAGASADSELGQKLRALGGELAEAKEQVSGFKEKLKPEGGEGGFLSRMKEQLEGALAPITSVRENLGEMIELVAAAFAIEKIADWIGETTEAAENFERMAAKLGISVEEVQSLGAVAKLTGGDVDEMAAQLEKLQLSLAKTGSKASPVAAALKVLGINLAEFRSASAAGQVDQMAEAFSRFADGSGKTAAAMALLGKTGADMIPFFDKGKEGLEELRKAAQETGVVMSAATIEAFSKTREDINALSLAWTGLSQKIYALVNPAVDAATKALTSLIEHADPKELQGYLTTFATSMVGGEASIQEFAVRAKADWEGLVTAISGSVPGIVGTLVDIHNKILNSLQPSAQEQALIDSGYANLWYKLGLTSDEAHKKAIEAAKALYQSGEAGASAFGAVDPAAEKLGHSLLTIAMNADIAKRKLAELLAEGAKGAAGDTSRHGEGEGGLATPKGLPQVPQMDIGGAAKAASEASRIALAGYAEDLEGFKANATAKEQSLAEQLKLHQATMSEWLAQTKDALEDERQDIIASYAAEQADARITKDAKINLKKEEQRQLDEITKQEAAAQAKADEATVAAWKAVGDGIAGILNSQVNALLHGTETIGQAFRNMAEMAIEELVKLAVKIAVDAAMLEALSIISGGTLGGFGSGGIGSWITSTLFPSHATGTPYVQNTGLALIHQGEAVIPASQNPNNPASRGARGGSGGDTHNYHIHSNASDPREVARQVARQWDRRPSSRPTY